jgi:hypothetical protein
MEKTKIGVLFIENPQKTTKGEGNEYMTGSVEGEASCVLIAYRNKSTKTGKEYWSIYKMPKDPQYQKPMNSEKGNDFTPDPVSNEELEDLPF